MRSLDLNVIYRDSTKAKRQLGWEYDISPDQLISLLLEEEEKFVSWLNSAPSV